MDQLFFAISAAVAQGMTSLDNLVVLFALLLSIGPVFAVGGYLSSQVIILATAFVVTLGTDQIAPGWVGAFGAVPIALGLQALWQQYKSTSDHQVAAGRKGISLTGVIILFLGLSFDSLSVMAPLLADSLPQYRLSGLAGAWFAVLALSGLALIAARQASPSARWAMRLERLAPYVMILVGVYVLMNTGTDVA